MSKKKINVIAPTIDSSGLAVSNTKKLKVCAYARVSTAQDEQLNSLETQREYYFKYINANPNWEFIDIYYDEGISGLNTRRREGFNRMVKDALDGKIDIILTKSISRFARNTIDTLTVTRMLKEKGIAIIFENENINSLDTKGEFVLTLMSSLAEEESKSISSNVKWGIRKKYAEGKFSMPYKVFIGYKKGPDGNMVIDKKEAPIIKLIFKMYLEGYSLKFISEKLHNMGVLSAQGNDYIGKSTLLAILTNEKYMGDAILQKSYVSDIFTKRKKKNKGELPIYHIENDHEPIIPKATFEEVKYQLSIRGKDYSVTHLFSSKLKCDLCGSFYSSNYYTKQKHHILYHRWICSKKFHKIIRCKNIIMYDNHLKQVIKEIFPIFIERYKYLSEYLIDLCIKTIHEKRRINRCITNIEKNKLIYTDEFIYWFSRMIIKEIIVKQSRELEFRFIDGFIYKYNLPLWSITKNQTI